MRHVVVEIWESSMHLAGYDDKIHVHDLYDMVKQEQDCAWERELYKAWRGDNQIKTHICIILHVYIHIYIHIYTLTIYIQYIGYFTLYIRNIIVCCHHSVSSVESRS